MGETSTSTPEVVVDDDLTQEARRQDLAVRESVMTSEAVVATRAEWRALADVAKQLHASKIYPRFTSEVQIAVAMAHARAMGLDPIAALPMIYPVNGVIEVMGRAILAAIYKSGLVRVVFTVNEPTRQGIRMERLDGLAVFETLWDEARAEKTGNAKKHGTHFTEWLRWRAVAECGRVVCPEVLLGTYLPGEVDDSTCDTQFTATREPLATVEKIVGPKRVGASGAEGFLGRLADLARAEGVAWAHIKLLAETARDALGFGPRWSDMTADELHEVEERVVASIDSRKSEDTTEHGEPFGDSSDDIPATLFADSDA